MLLRLLRFLFVFRGRVSRGTYLGCTALLAAAFVVLFVFLDAVAGYASTLVLYPPFLGSLAALTVKRLHDRGHSAWRLLIVLIPVIGPIWLLVGLFLRSGSPGENQYGDDPRLVDADYLTVS
jgi:uncharacterized membrane protein YhaH (DUF805 family)